MEEEEEEELEVFLSLHVHVYSYSACVCVCDGQILYMIEEREREGLRALVHAVHTYIHVYLCIRTYTHTHICIRIYLCVCIVLLPMPHCLSHGHYDFLFLNGQNTLPA